MTISQNDAKELRRLVERAQELLTANLTPNGPTDGETINDLLELLDNREVVDLMKRTEEH